MQALKDEITRNAAPVQSSLNYINADEDLKDQFDHALSNARKAIVKATGKNLDETEIEGLKQAIEDTKDTLNEEQRLAEAKAKGQQYLQTLTHLNDAQRNAAENEIKTSEDLTSLAETISNTTNLDEAMKDLHETLVNNATPVHASVNYVNADDDLKQQFDTALQQARNTLAKATGEPASIDEVRGLSQTIEDTKDALNGEQRLAEAKVKS